MNDEGSPLYGPGLEEPGELLFELANGPYYLTIAPLLWGQAKLGVTRLDNPFRTKIIERGYDYAHPLLALAAALRWNPETEEEPDGWHRCPQDGRRRPDGDPAQEYICE